jgi:hypothetical protein
MQYWILSVIPWMLVAQGDSEPESLFDPGTDLFAESSSINPGFAVNQGRLGDPTGLFVDVSSTDPISTIVDEGTLEGTNPPPPLGQRTEPDQSLLDCGDPSLFNKIRRGATCRPLTGQADRPGPSGNEEKSPMEDDDEFNFNQFINNRPKPSFFKLDFELCPPGMFGSSTTPVCHNLRNVVVPPGQSKIPVLEFVSPRTTCLIGGKLSVFHSLAN